MHLRMKISLTRARKSGCPLPVVPARGAEDVGPRSAAATESAAPRALTTLPEGSALAWLGPSWPASRLCRSGPGLPPCATASRVPSGVSIRRKGGEDIPKFRDSFKAENIFTVLRT